ncbi:MAG: divalent-cation tolerance protein CutA [Planctomycetes bacterium]|nr:divalent-cation tolerance protein CutA [Planctomycetota bacterium]MCB9905628.1 divalent-cation tolerance protein CutA [Planctomycetota bacterium]
MTQGTSAEPRIVLVTAPDDGVARRLARGMVDARLAACVNLLPGAISVYRWQGEVHEEPEVLMLIKTTDERLSELVDFVEREHPYELPEFVVLDPEAIEHGYREWLLSECSESGADEA